MTKEIPLASGKGVVLVDDDMFEKLSKFRWCRKHGGARRSQYLGKDPITGKPKIVQYYMHREIMNCPKGLQVDHVNRDRFDNQRHNLGICTNAQNSRNRSKCRGKSMYKGVGWSSLLNKWRVTILTDGSFTCLGFYDCQHEAARVYNKAAIEQHKEFAYINIIQED